MMPFKNLLIFFHWKYSFWFNLLVTCNHLVKQKTFFVIKVSETQEITNSRSAQKKLCYKWQGRHVAAFYALKCEIGGLMWIFLSVLRTCLHRGEDHQRWSFLHFHKNRDHPFLMKHLSLKIIIKEPFCKFPWRIEIVIFSYHC